MQLSWCHTKVEMVVGFEDLFTTFSDCAGYLHAPAAPDTILFL